MAVENWVSVGVATLLCKIYFATKTTRAPDATPKIHVQVQEVIRRHDDI